MNKQQFIESTEAAEMMLNALADSTGADADWSQAWVEFFADTFILRIVYPPGTKKTRLKWLLAARRQLAKETQTKWLFCIYRMKPISDKQICFDYQELISKHGGGVDWQEDVDELSEGL